MHCHHDQQVSLLCLVPVNTPYFTQWNIRIICPTNEEAHGAPRTKAPLHPMMILLKYAVCVTAATPVTHLCMSTPLRYPSTTKPILHTHTHLHRPTTPPRAREGVESGLRCKTPPASFNFHLPHYDPLQLVTQVASCCTSRFFFLYRLHISYFSRQ